MPAIVQARPETSTLGCESVRALRAHHSDPHAPNLLGLSGPVSDHAAEGDLHAPGRSVEAACERQAPAGAGERAGAPGDGRCPQEGDLLPLPAAHAWALRVLSRSEPAMPLSTAHH
jgi:hypothetical protein